MTRCPGVARRSIQLVAALTLTFLVAACTSSKPSGSRSTSSAGRSTATLVALGDSDTNGHGDPSGIGWVGYYVASVRAATGQRFMVRNLAADGLTSDDLLRKLSTDQTVRTAVAGAQFVLIGLGGGDLNTADANYLAKTCPPAACYGAAIKRYGRNMAAVAAEVTKLRAGAPTVLRALSGPNIVPGALDVIPPELAGAAKEFGLFQARGLKDQNCRAMTQHGGRCIDVVTAINGPSGTADGYAAGLINHDNCCYPSAAGQQLMAKLLVETGIKPTVLR